jgi:hypothetical protein
VAVRKPVFVAVKDAVKVDTVLLSSNPNFNIDELRYVPIVSPDANGKRPEFEMEAKFKEISKIQVPLFEARVPYEVFLKGLDRQQIINLIDEKAQKNNFTGSITVTAASDTVINNQNFKKGAGITIAEADVVREKLVADFANRLSAADKKKFDEEKIKWMHYPGLRVGSITNPNNDAGNWE